MLSIWGGTKPLVDDRNKIHPIIIICKIDFSSDSPPFFYMNHLIMVFYMLASPSIQIKQASSITFCPLIYRINIRPSIKRILRLNND